MTEPASAEPQKGPGFDLPSSITISTFTTARMKEFQAMKKAISERAGVKMAFQRLPKHMRRRAMSHNVKRLPRRLREIHISQMRKSGLPPKSKRPSRKYRRRPYNLLSDYARRRRRVQWLDTHIWHAKRFHMIEKWGYKLPHRPCDKSFKACYRATTQHCLIQDISYNQCIEISGSFQNIVENLARMTDPKLGLTFGATCFSEESIERETVKRIIRLVPQIAISQLNFYSIPNDNVQSTKISTGKKFGEVTVFEPTSNKNGFRKAIGQIEFFWNPKNITAERQLWIFVHPAFYKQLLDALLLLFNLDPMNMETKDELDVSVSTYGGPHGIILKELQYELGKFRLTGPLSTAVLKRALKVVNFKEKPGNLPGWCNNFDLEKLTRQNTTFQDLSDLSLLPPNMVLSVMVHDPRFNFPKKRTKALPTTVSSDNDNFEALQQNASLSPLWNEDVRKCVKQNKISNKNIFEMRSQLLVPGSDLEQQGEPVPVILLWRTGNKGVKNNGYSSGWDIILSSSWSQSFFLSFIMWGARAGGLRETESIAFERSQCGVLYPDTVAGENEEKYISDSLKERYFRLPPNKRTNFSRFGIVSPVSFNWKLLFKDWNENGSHCDNFFVIRNRSILKSVQEFLTTKSKNVVIPPLPENCLIPVKLAPLKKGLCRKFSIICVPKEEDFKSEPVEPKRKDSLARKRNAMRREHKTLLKRLRRRRKRAKAAELPIIKPSEALLEDYKVNMRNLWLPEAGTIKSSCARDIMGFVKQGDFSFTLGQSKGLGYIVANSLKMLETLSRRNILLLRNTNSRQYRLALLEVLFD